MSTAAWAVQVALVARLSPVLGAVPVFDGSAPDGQPMPYVVMGEKAIAPWDSLGRAGEDIITTIHVWDERPQGGISGQELDRLLGLVRGALNRHRLPLPSLGCVTPLTVVSETSFSEPGGRVRHGVIRIRARVRPASP